MEAQSGTFSLFSHSLAVFTEAWFKLHCGRVDPKDCDRRGEELHMETEEEGGYRLVKANRPCWCIEDFDKDCLKCHGKMQFEYVQDEQ